MNERPIDQARDRDLRYLQQALERAAQRAQDLARLTGTFIVVSTNGVIEHLTPTPDKDQSK
jgi:2-polyprenyl-3-methyl-5-hydroxy-6-metoxy-1,4-benzoquinol methylase